MVIDVSVKNMATLDSGGNNLCVKEVAGSFTKIRAPYLPFKSLKSAPRFWQGYGLDRLECLKEYKSRYKENGRIFPAETRDFRQQK